jgi:hypothetical protein
MAAVLALFCTGCHTLRGSYVSYCYSRAVASRGTTVVVVNNVDTCRNHKVRVPAAAKKRGGRIRLIK